jgi:hypothetical protein
MVTFTEEHALAAPRALLTHGAVIWATDALTDDDTTVAALARRLDVDWHTLWDALKVEAHRRADDPNRLTGVESLGVDEHIWRPGSFGQGREVTCMVDLTHDANGQVRARLLDLVLGRSGPAYAAWLEARQPEFRRVSLRASARLPVRQALPARHATTLISEEPSNPRRSTRSAATPTRCATRCPTWCRSWTPFMTTSWLCRPGVGTGL